MQARPDQIRQDETRDEVRQDYFDDVIIAGFFFPKRQSFGTGNRYSEFPQATVLFWNSQS
jgi:hypothetical protein